MTDSEIRDFLQQAIGENRVMLFMKGTPEAPACGFSARTSGALNALGVRYAALDILPDPRIRQELSAISNWPTIPQLFVDAKLVGGCDIVTEMYESGELAGRRAGIPPSADSAAGGLRLPVEVADVLGNPVGVVDDLVAVDEHWDDPLAGEILDLRAVSLADRDAHLVEVDSGAPQATCRLAARAEVVGRRLAAVEGCHHSRVLSGGASRATAAIRSP